MKKWIALFVLMVIPLYILYPNELYLGPYLQNVTSTRITIMWETKKAVIGTVEFGQAGKYNHKQTEKKPAKIHEVHLTKLKPGKTYNYRVLTGKNMLGSGSFKTAPPPNTNHSWRLVVYGDSRSYPILHKKNVDQMIKTKPAIVLNTGDLVTNGKVYEQWKPQFFDPLRGLAEYVPVYTCLGNHEENAVHYYNYMSLPEENGEAYYSFNYANAHIICLFSNSSDFEPKQTEWLVADLKANKSHEWKIVFFHHPLFGCNPSRGIHPARWIWHPIFEQYGVDLVFNGHDHHYQRTYAIGDYVNKSRHGVCYFVTGGGGAGLHPTIPTAHSARQQEVHHIMVLDFLQNRLLGRAIDINGNVFDAFMIDKGAEIPPAEFIAYEVYQIHRDLIKAIQLLAVDQRVKEVKIDTTIEVKNPFGIPIRVLFLWNDIGDWACDPQEMVHTFKVDEPIKIPLKITGQQSGNTKLPTFTLYFTTPEGKRAFYNDQLTFSLVIPIKANSTMVPRAYWAYYKSMMEKYGPVRLPLPIRRMDGTSLQYKPITDNYPDDGMRLNSFTLSGQVLEVRLDHITVKGHAELESDEFEINGYTSTALKNFEIEFKSESMHKKLCIGRYKILPWPKVIDDSILKNLGKDELYAVWIDDLHDYSEVNGILVITGYAENGVAGKIDISLKHKDGTLSKVKGKFKLPLILE